MTKIVVIISLETRVADAVKQMLDSEMLSDENSARWRSAR